MTERENDGQGESSKTGPTFSKAKIYIRIALFQCGAITREIIVTKMLKVYIKCAWLLENLPLGFQPCLAQIDQCSCRDYRKVPKFLDTRKLCCNLPKIQTERQNLKNFCQNDANGIANSEDPDQTAPLGAV